MKRSYSTITFAALTAILLSGMVARAVPEPAPAPSDPARVARGKYLVSIMGCHDCHTPLKLGPRGPEPDMDRALTGHPEQLTMPPAPELPPEVVMGTRERYLQAYRKLTGKELNLG